MRVKKHNGALEEYEPTKIRSSLVHSGASGELANSIVNDVNGILYDGIPTWKIFRHAYKELKKHAPGLAPRYDIKGAILRLGTAGFAFERFVSHILEKQGYSTVVGLTVKGEYIEHEIDVLAKKGEETLMVECKHHKEPWLGCKIQTALYVYARFLEVRKTFTEPMLVTNTKFSPQILAYSKGVGIRLMGWKYPPDDSLEGNIERYRLYPVTSIRSLDKGMIEALFKEEIVTLDDLLNRDAGWIAKELKIDEQRASAIFEEAKTLN
jgi:hypothetical protein